MKRLFQCPYCKYHSLSLKERNSHVVAEHREEILLWPESGGWAAWIKKEKGGDA